MHLFISQIEHFLSQVTFSFYLYSFIFLCLLHDDVNTVTAKNICSKNIFSVFCFCFNSTFQMTEQIVYCVV